MIKVREFCVTYDSTEKYAPSIQNLTSNIFKAVYDNPQRAFYSYNLKKRISWESLWKIQHNNNLLLKRVNLNIQERAFILEFYSAGILINSPEGLITIEGDRRFIDNNSSLEVGAKIISDTLRDISQCFSD